MGGEVPERQRRQGNESVASSVRMRSLYLKREAGGLHTPRAREWPRVGMRGESEGERAGGPTPSGSPPAETSRATEGSGGQPARRPTGLHQLQRGRRPSTHAERARGPVERDAWPRVATPPLPARRGSEPVHGVAGPRGLETSRPLSSRAPRDPGSFTSCRSCRSSSCYERPEAFPPRARGEWPRVGSRGAGEATRVCGPADP